MGQGGGVLERGAIFEIGLERGAQKNEIVNTKQGKKVGAWSEIMGWSGN